MRRFLQRLFSSPVFIVGVAFLLRMLVMFSLWRDMPAAMKTNLPYGYELGRVARAIAAGEGFSSPLRDLDSGPTAWFTPIYPYLVAGIFKTCGIYSDLSHAVITTMNCAFSALTIIPIHAIAKRTFGNGVAAGSSWIWVVLPNAIIFPISWVWDTSLITLVFALIFWATLALRGTRTVLPWAGYGALWVSGVLINPSILSVFPFFLAWLLWSERKQWNLCGKHAAAVLLLFTIGLVPWTVRNYRVFGKIIVLRSNFGLELWLGNNPDAISLLSQIQHPNDNAAEAAKYKRMGEIAYMAEKQHEAIEFMRKNPGETANRAFHRFVNIWMRQTDSIVDIWSTAPLTLKAFLAFNTLLPLLCMLGALFAYRAGSPDAAPYALVLLIFPLVFYVTHATSRYRFPMDPIVAVLATSSVAHLISAARSQVSRRWGSATPVASLPSN